MNNTFEVKELLKVAKKRHEALCRDRDEIIKYGMGERNTLPNRSDYGLTSEASESQSEISKDQ